MFRSLALVLIQQRSQLSYLPRSFATLFLAELQGRRGESVRAMGDINWLRSYGTVELPSARDLSLGVDQPLFQF